MAQAYTQTVDEVLQAQQVEPDRGLAGSRIAARRKRHGRNVLREAQTRSAWRILLDQFESLIVFLLLVAAALAIAFGQFLEGIVIAAALVINAAIGFATEMKATRSMEALRRLGRESARVRRDGEVSTVAAADLVPGDIVVLAEGDLVPADLRLVAVENLQCDESTLTGEAMPAGKSREVLAGESPLAERSNMAYRGTAVTRGEGEGVVVAIGRQTELGRISELVEEAAGERTPLEKRLDRLGRRLIWLTLAVAVVIAAVGIASGKDLLVMIKTALALAIAAVPEGLPIVATIALARGMRRMARRNALVKQLSAVETLGATTTILTDKTGTLTENRMTAERIVLADGEVFIAPERAAKDGRFLADGRPIEPSERPALRSLLEVGVLCNNATLGRGEGFEEQAPKGDPMERALLELGRHAGLERDDLRQRFHEVREVSFDTATKMMATYHRADDGLRVAVKGAPEAVFEACDRVAIGDGAAEFDEATRAHWQGETRRLASEGLRVLAFADKQVSDEAAAPYERLTLLGLVGLLDPPREDAKHAVTACRRAGIRVVMVTGDQAETARNIARAVGISEADDARVVEGADLERARAEGARPGVPFDLLETTVFARVTPEHKLDLLTRLQESGQVVGMTGDGVNDAPALKKADIGIAMGRRGTEVAREAGDIVLQDDSLPTIVAAIEQGRVIYGNIRKFIVFLLSGNLGEIIAVGLAALINAPLPLLPLQILFINLLLDVFPALALGVGEGSAKVLERPPRDPREPVLPRRSWIIIWTYGVIIAFSVLAAFALALAWLGLPPEQAVSVSFLTFGFARLGHAFNMRSADSGLLRNEVTGNPWMWGAVVLCAALLLAGTYLPVLSDILTLSGPSLAAWVLVVAMSLVPLAIGQAIPALRLEER